ncbi:glycosyltransferase family 2 protein [Methylomonas montana]|uniref:glycosyltransferase family 2 protein n=1 Tax=Methylomonas montana TaxID=3058963 RepID=UPI002657B61F|nr:glycosyltransferase family 2 protein [Methylomonas montana]WKJ92035.1 glycosyltransferase family 2 protein [Methylomonas montana]
MRINGQEVAAISVIVPCFRCRDTIKRALDSILAQTRPVAQIILVDDASGDDTFALLAQLVKLDEQRIQVLALPKNRGPGGARNAGWDMATQPWLAFLDADDVWHPQKIEIQFGWLEKQSAVDLCAHEYSQWNEALNKITPDWLEPFQLSVYPILFKNPIPTRSVIMRKDVPYRFGEKMRAEDYLLWLSLALSDKKLWKLPIQLAFTFRPEFSADGYSGNLIVHERCELGVFKILYQSKLLALPVYLSASLFSLLKFVRRCVIRSMRRFVGV